MVKIGIVGAGGMGNVHMRQYKKMPDVEVASFDRSPERLQQYCANHEVQGFDSVENLLDWCDIVDVCLPTDLHLDLALQGIAASKGVFVEKPMCKTVEEGRALLEAETKHSGWVMPLQVVRCFPEFRRAHELVKSGALGDVAVIRSRRGGRFPLGSDQWFRNFERSGGVLLDLCCHDFDWMRWTVGEVSRVQARWAAVSAKVPVEGDFALTILEFENGALGHQEGTWLDPSGFRTTFEICGSEGMLEHDSRLTKTLQVHTETGTAGESPMAPQDDPYYLQFRGAVDAWKARERPPVTAMDGFKTVAIARAAIESAKTGKAVVPEQP